MMGDASDSYRWGKAVGGDEAGGSPAIEVRNEACEVMGEAQEI